jgi:hypothetical protein
VSEEEEEEVVVVVVAFIIDNSPLVSLCSSLWMTSVAPPNRPLLFMLLSHL